MAIVGMLAVSGLGAGATSAFAALNDCDSNHMCMWANNDYAVMIGERNHGEANIVNLSTANRDRMDSWANRSATHTGCMYSGLNGTSDKQTMGRVSNDNNVSPLNSDEVKSWRTKNGC